MECSSLFVLFCCVSVSVVTVHTCVVCLEIVCNSVSVYVVRLPLFVIVTVCVSVYVVK